MNEVTVFVGSAALILLIALRIRNRLLKRAGRESEDVQYGPEFSNGSSIISDFTFDAPTNLGDDVTLAPVSTYSLSVVYSRLAEGPETGTQYQLVDGVNALGRAPTAEPQVTLISLERDRAISCNHLYIESGQNGILRASDRGSRNGTRLNGERLQPENPRDLNTGDLLTLGNTTFKLEQESESGLNPMIRIVPRYQFQVVGGPAKDQTHTMNQDRIQIGRGQECDWRLPDGKVSRLHAEIRREGDLVRLVDQSSANGLFVNDRRYQSRVLENGDIIKLGDTRIKFDKVYG